MKKFLQKLARKMGYDVKGFPLPEHDQANPFYVQKFLFTDTAEPVIFDVGAANGETVQSYKNVFPRCQIYSFEPFKQFFDTLRANHPDIQSFNVALGNKNGSIDFHVNASLGTNSILPTDARGASNWWSGVLETREVIQIPVMTLDTFAIEHAIDHIDMLKMDTQGTEYNVLEGATETLKKTKLVFTEIIVVPTYQGQKEMDEILKLLRQSGFYLHNFYNIWLGKGKTKGRIRQMDAIFLNERYFPQ